MIRRIDDLGRLVIPAEIRRKIGWDYNSPVEIKDNGYQIILETPKSVCTVCGSEDDLIFSPKLNQSLCKECLNHFNNDKTEAAVDLATNE